MSERADDDVRGEQRKAARQPKHQQGEGSIAMATVGERRSLPSPEIMLGQPWSEWVDAAKIYGNEATEFEESFKECGKNREAMRLCTDDMALFGQCPAQDDFYLVMCSHCSQLVKPQAFQAHYERRHGSSSKPPLALAPSAPYPLPTLLTRNKGGGTGSSAGGSGRATGSNGSSSNSKILKPPKEKLPVHGRPNVSYSAPPGKITSPSDKVEKVPAKLAHAPSSSATVSSSLKPSLICSSIPKVPLLSPGQTPNGKGLLTSLDKRQDDGASNKRDKRISEREFNADFHCGVLEPVTRKPCMRSLTCKTHSLSQRRAVLGRRKRFDALLAEHKGRAREKETHRGLEHPQHAAPLLRDPHPFPPRLAKDPHQASHGNSTSDAKPSLSGKPRPHNPSLPRPNSHSSHPCGNTQGDPSAAREPPHHSFSSSIPDGTSRLSSDEGETEEKEDCHYSGYHPQPAALCTFGSRQLGKSCYGFNRCWDRVRWALSAMVDQHVSSLMWKRIPPISEMVSSTTSDRTSTNSLPASPHHSGNGSRFLCPAPATSSPALVPPHYAQSLDSRSVPSYGTTLNARVSPAYSPQARQASLWPQLPSGHSAIPSPTPSRPPKAKPSGKPFRSRETLSAVPGLCGGISNSTAGSGKKRKSSSPLSAHPPYSAESPSSSFSSSSSRRNNAASLGGSGSAYHPPLTSSTSSFSSHGIGLNCAPCRTSSLGLKHEQAGKGPPSGSPAESIKRMSVVMNSSDSTLSLGPFVHQAADPHCLPSVRLEEKPRKALSGASGPGRPIKVPKVPIMNDIHSKRGRNLPG